MANKRMLVNAAKRFVYNCDTGLAQSKESYQQFKDALEGVEIPKEFMSDLGYQYCESHAIFYHSLISCPACELQEELDHNDPCQEVSYENS